MKEHKPDYRNPNRKVKFGSRTKRVMPQLVYFSILGDIEVVEKLLNQGANVNLASEVGDTAIMLSLREINPTLPSSSMNRRLFDLIASKPHKSETINIRTMKKRLLPLSEAIYSGQPDIVHKLLSMGADPNLRSGTDLQTPLNIALKLLGFISHPDFYWSESKRHLMSSANLDGLRRNLPSLISSLREAEKFTKRLSSDPNFIKISKTIQDQITEKTLKHTSSEKIREIAKILIDAGADPNAEHAFPLPGYTPMMLAAETDDEDIFEYMLSNGGNPEKSYFHKPDNQSYDCYGIALMWSSSKVFTLLKSYKNRSSQ